ncbi:hypothetical protein [Streptomyces sp. NPDC050504]|uniref:hypothetical protein n=1 Tax=Streptomyces sp. NPDC050504 TaxID=3365618 RepID=UPI0037AA5DE7
MIEKEGTPDVWGMQIMEALRELTEAKRLRLTKKLCDLDAFANSTEREEYRPS